VATLVRRDTTAATTNNQTTYASSSFTPTAGDLLVVLIRVTGVSGSAPRLAASANGITFGATGVGEPLINQFSNASAHKNIVFVANQLVGASPSAMTLTLTLTAGDTGSGAVVSVIAVTGMSRAGVAAVLQFKADDNSQTAGGTPAVVVLPAAPQSANPLLGWTGIISTGGMTPPTGWTELLDLSYSTPTTGFEVAGLASGGSSATITWGSNSTVGAHGVIEFDTSAAGFSASATFGGAGTLTTAASPTIPVSAGFSGAGTLSPAGAPAIATPAGFGGSGTLSTSSSPAIPKAATGAPSTTAAFSGGGTLSAASSPAIPKAAGFSGAGTLTAGASPTIPVSAGFGGAGTLSAASSPTIPKAAGFSGSGTLTATGSTSSPSANAGFAGGGTLSTAASPSVPKAAAFSGSGTLTAATKPSAAAPATFSGSGTLGTSAKPSWAATAGFSGAGTLTLVVSPTVPLPAAFSGSGTLTAARVATPVRARLVGLVTDQTSFELGVRRLPTRDNLARLRAGELTWVGPITYRPASAILNLAAVPAGSTPLDVDYAAADVVDGRSGAMLALAGRGTYGLWARDAADGDPARFATITVT
jgi:hypothetical protein